MSRADKVIWLCQHGQYKAKCSKRPSDSKPVVDTLETSYVSVFNA